MRKGSNGAVTKSRMKDGIVKRGDSFHSVVREPSRNGKTKPVWSPAYSTRAEAEADRDRRRVEVRAGTAVVKNSITVAEYLDSWLPKHIALAALAPTTQVAYRSKIDSYIKPHLGHMKLQALRSDDIEAFYVTLLTTPSERRGSGLAPATVIYVARVLRKALQHAVDVYGILARNPAQSVSLPTAKPIHRDVWSAEQMRAFLLAAQEGTLGPLLWLLGATGARRGELLALKWANVDLDAGSLRIVESATFANGQRYEGLTKNKEQRLVYLDQQTVAVLRKHHAVQASQRLRAGEKWHDAGLVFCSGDGSPLPPDAPYAAMRVAMAKANVPQMRLHDLRHLHATWLLEDGEPLHVVAERLGHRDPMVTATIYAHVNQRQSAGAAETFASRLADK